jgi:hypothetical protein
MPQLSTAEHAVALATKVHGEGYHLGAHSALEVPHLRHVRHPSREEGVARWVTHRYLEVCKQKRKKVKGPAPLVKTLPGITWE